MNEIEFRAELLSLQRRLNRLPLSRLGMLLAAADELESPEAKNLFRRQVLLAMDQMNDKLRFPETYAKGTTP